MIRKLISLSVLMTIVLTMAFAAAPTQAASPNGVCAQFHTVQRGENLYRIANRYGTSIAAIQSLNGISNPNRIYAGQTLCIATGSYIPGHPGGTTYVVQYGDRLSRIAQRFGVSMWVLAQVNNIYNPNRIYAGQVLHIPDVTIQ